MDVDNIRIQPDDNISLRAIQAFPERFAFAAPRAIIWQNLLMDINRDIQALRNLPGAVFRIGIDQDNFIQQRRSLPPALVLMVWITFPTVFSSLRAGSARLIESPRSRFRLSR